MVRCAFVIRVSDSRQHGTRGDSFENQKSQLEAYIDFLNKAHQGQSDSSEIYVPEYVMHDTYRLDGVPGDKSLDDFRIQELRDDILQGNVDLVLATRLDRFGRSVTKFLDFYKFLQDNKVDLAVTHYQIDTSTSGGKFVMTILMAVAEMQRDQMSENQMKIHRTHFYRGRKSGGSPPLGFTNHPSRPGYEIVEEGEAAVIRCLFQTFISMRSYEKTARELNAKGFRTKEKNPFKGKAVKSLLQNKRYIGMLEYNKAQKGVEGGGYDCRFPDNPEDWPAIVDNHTFEKAAIIMEEIGKGYSRNSSKKQTYPYPLIGIIHCGFCGDPMESDSTAKKATDSTLATHNYYACCNEKCPGRDDIPEHFRGKRRNGISAQVLDKAIKEYIRDTVLSNSEHISEIVDYTNRDLKTSIPDKKKFLRATQHRLEEVIKLKEGSAKALSSLDSITDSAPFSSVIDDIKRYSDEAAKIRESISKQEKELDELQKNLITPEFLRRTLEILVDCETIFEPERQKALIHAVIQDVRVHLREITIRLNSQQLNRIARHESNANKLVRGSGGGSGSGWMGPLLDGFERSDCWYAHRDSNPKPSGP